MKRLTLMLLSVLSIVLLVSSCSDKKTIVEITELDTYSDPATGFAIQYPKSWEKHNNLGERFLTYTTKDVLGRFKTFATEGVSGAKIDYQVVKLADGQNMDTVMSKKLFEGKIYSAPQAVTIDGVSGFKQTYSFPLKDGKFQGEIYYAQKDPDLVAVISFEAFADGFDTYKSKFDEILKSAVLPMKKSAKSDTLKEILEADPPSSNLVAYNGDGFSIKVPDNFDVKKPKPGSYKFDGERRGDCYILVDIIDASKQTDLDKIVQDNKANFGGNDPKATKISGQKAYLFQYNPGGNISRKAYFVIKGSKLYRLIVDWNRVEDKDLFIPIFDKCVASFTFK